MQQSYTPAHSENMPLNARVYLNLQKRPSSFGGLSTDCTCSCQASLNCPSLWVNSKLQNHLNPFTTVSEVACVLLLAMSWPTSCRTLHKAQFACLPCPASRSEQLRRSKECFQLCPNKHERSTCAHANTSGCASRYDVLPDTRCAIHRGFITYTAWLL